MCGAKVETPNTFSYLSPKQRVPQDHPIRVIADQSLAKLGVITSPQTFEHPNQGCAYAPDPLGL